MTHERSRPDEQGHAPVVPSNHRAEHGSRQDAERDPKRDPAKGEKNPWTREGPNAPDAADIADPKEQL